MNQLLHCRPVELASNLIVIAIPQGIYPGILVKDRDPPKCKSVILLVIKFVDLGMYHPKPYLLFCIVFFFGGDNTRGSKQRTFGVGEPGRISTWYAIPSFQELKTLFFSTSATRVFSQKSSNHSQIKSANPHISILMDHSISLRIQTKKKKVPYPPPCWVQGSKLLPHLDLSVRPWAVGSRIII